mgnify:CR=1 FL=1
MNGEILSIETVQKISRLEKENSQYEKMICDFDMEVNRLFNIIKDAINLINEKSTGDLKITFGNELLSILNKVYEVQNV